MIAVIALCGMTQVNAQIYAGGSLGFTSTKLSGGGISESGSSFKILPEIGYQYSKDLAFGASFGYVKGYAALGSFDATDFKALINTVMSTAIDLSSSGSGGLNLKSFRFAPYARYTLLETGKLQFFVDGVLGYSLIKADLSGLASLAGSSSVPSGTQDLTMLEVCVRPGVAVSLSDNFKIVAKFGSLGFQSLKIKDVDPKITRFGLDFDSNNLLLGAVYYF